MPLLCIFTTVFHVLCVCRNTSHRPSSAPIHMHGRDMETSWLVAKNHQPAGFHVSAVHTWGQGICRRCICMHAWGGGREYGGGSGAPLYILFLVPGCFREAQNRSWGVVLGVDFSRYAPVCPYPFLKFSMPSHI